MDIKEKESGCPRVETRYRARKSERKKRLRLSLLINNFAADDGHHHLRLEDLLRSSFVEVFRIHDDVGQHSRSDSSLPLFFELRVGGTYGVCTKTFIRVQALLRLPATFGGAVGQLARDAGVNSTQRINGDHGIVRAESLARAISFSAAPGVSDPNALGAQAVGRPTRVIQKMHRMHGGEHI